MGLIQGRWPNLGSTAEWDRSEWPMPVFVRYEELTGRSFKVTYDEDDPARMLEEEKIPPRAAGQGPKDGLMGAGFVEKVLTSAMH